MENIPPKGNIPRCYLGVNTRRKIQTGWKYKEKEEKGKKQEESGKKVEKTGKKDKMGSKKVKNREEFYVKKESKNNASQEGKKYIIFGKRGNKHCFQTKI
jgi:hypothetical protein